MAPFGFLINCEQFRRGIRAVHIQRCGAPLYSEWILQTNLLGSSYALSQLTISPHLVDISAIVEEDATVRDKTIVESEGDDFFLNEFELYLRFFRFFHLLLSLFLPAYYPFLSGLQLLAGEDFVKLNCLVSVKNVQYCMI